MHANPLRSGLAAVLLAASATAQGHVYEQPVFAGGGNSCPSSYWVDPTGQNDYGTDAQGWEDFELPVTTTVTRVRWWGAAALPLGFKLCFFNQDPNTVAVQPDGFDDQGTISTQQFPNVTGVLVSTNLYRYEVTLTTPLTFQAHTRYFVSVLGLTPTAGQQWEWAQGTNGVHGTFWWQRSMHMFFQLGGDRALGLAGADGWGVGSAYCGGAAGACPCSNPGVRGAGCANSTTRGAALFGFGDALVGADTLRLSAVDCPANQPGLFFGGPTALAGALFGDGLRCVGGSVVRLGVVTTSAAGAAQSQLPIAAREGLVGGELRHYQYWYRDPAGPCGGGFNTSNALSVQW